MIAVDDPDFILHVGDALEVLATLPDESVHCVVTSPPYWGLRDYGTGSWEGGDDGCDHLAPPMGTRDRGRDRAASDGTFHDSPEANRLQPQFRDVCGKCGARRVDHQLGLEPTPEEYVSSMVAVFREVRRVLRRDGTCWLNIGDSYASSPPGNVAGVGATSGLHGANDANGVYRETLKAGHATKRNTVVSGLKPKDLVGIPWRLAFALHADGWYLRSDIIWSKPNPMPESVTDRPTKAHEYLFLLTKSARYFYDANAIRETITSEASIARNGSTPRQILRAGARQPDTDDRPAIRSHKQITEAGRNKRSVWEIATEPYPDAHFATFPQALVEPCVLAGTSERGCCPVCGAPWERETDVDYANPGNRTTNGPRSVEARDDPMRGTINSRGSRLERRTTTIGWRPTCECFPGVLDGYFCPENHPVPSTVLDPFMGSGTVAVVARRLGRRAVGIELNPVYAALCVERTRQLSLLASR